MLSEGEFRQGDGEWFEPGVGGTFYNPPGIVHAMRSGNKPLFALWFLWAGQGVSEEEVLPQEQSAIIRFSHHPQNS